MSNRIEKLRQLPVVKNLLEERYRRYFQSATECHLFRGVYASFADAAASIPVHRRSGYDQPEPASMYQDELGELRPTDYPVLFWLDRLLQATTSIVDFGGHVGVKYYAFSKYLSIPENYSWTVCDVPAVAAAGAELAAREGAPIKFVSSLRDAGAHDILFCSGSLQYLEASLAEMLAELDGLPRHVVVNSTPMSDLPEYFTVNNIGTAFCPYKIQNVARFTEDMQRLGYEVVDRWQNLGKACPIPFYPQHSLDHYTGFYLRRP